MSVRVTTERPQIRRTSPLWRVVAVGLGVLLLCGAFFLGQRTTTSSPAPSASSAGDASVAVSPSGSGSAAADGLTPTQGMVTVDGNPIDGLYIGTATVAQGARSTVYGIAYGWERTLEGAVAAAMTAEAAWYALPNLVEYTVLDFSDYFYTGTAYKVVTSDDYQAADLRVARREAFRLSDDGVVVTAAGVPSSEEIYYGGGVPEYGAYKVLDLKEEEAGQLVSVTVATFMPIYAGPGTETNLEDVRVCFRQEQSLMVWDDAAQTWKVQEWVGDSVQPIDVEYTNQGYQYLRDQLGPGWAVPADATQEPFAGAVKTR